MQSPVLGYWVQPNSMLDKFRTRMVVYQAQRSLANRKAVLKRPKNMRKHRGWMSEDEKDYIPTATTKQNLLRRVASFENMLHYIGPSRPGMGEFRLRK